MCVKPTLAYPAASLSLPPAWPTASQSLLFAAASYPPTARLTTSDSLPLLTPSLNHKRIEMLTQSEQDCPLVLKPFYKHCIVLKNALKINTKIPVSGVRIDSAVFI